jgi:methyl-accepting chemotaxis protein
MEWISNLKIAQKITGVVILSALFLGIVGFTGLYISNQNAKSMQAMYYQNTQPIEWLNTIVGNINAIKCDLFALMLTKDNERRQLLNDEIAAARDEDNKLIALYEKTDMDSFESQQFQEFKKSLTEYRIAQRTVVALIKQNKGQEANDYFEKNSQSLTDATSALRKIVKYDSKLAKELAKRGEDESSFGTVVILGLGILAVILCLWIGMLIANEIKKRLSNLQVLAKEVAGGDLTAKVKIVRLDEIGVTGQAIMDIAENIGNLIRQINGTVQDVSAGSEEMSAAADQTAQGAQQVSTSVTQLAAGSQEQASQVSQGVEKLSLMNKVVQKIYQNADSVVKLANSADDGAQKGHDEAEKAVAKINQIKGTATTTAETAHRLGVLGTEIEQIVDLIKGIAGQTNLLALNAAIEAARAGEHGKGFAVVADEVKKLAGESSNATDKITNIVKQVQSMTNNVVADMDKSMKEIDEGVVTIENVGIVLSEILTVAKTVSKQADEVSDVSNLLVKDSEEVVSLMEGVASITEESAASAEEIASITEEQTASVEEINASSQALAKIAENLQKQVSVFRV